MRRTVRSAQVSRLSVSYDYVKEGKSYIAKSICKPRHWNLDIGIGIGIGTDITKVIISSSIRHLYPILSRVVTKDEETPPTKSCDTSISHSRDKSKTLYLHFH